MTRATGKQLGSLLALGAVGLFAGIALFMTLFAAPARRVDSCARLAEFMEPRLVIVDRRAGEHLGGISNDPAWRAGADRLADIYFAFGRDMTNRKILNPDDDRVRRHATWIGKSAIDVGETLIALDATIRKADNLTHATTELRQDLVRARRRCR